MQAEQKIHGEEEHRVRAVREDTVTPSFPDGEAHARAAWESMSHSPKVTTGRQPPSFTAAVLGTGTARPKI